MPNTALNPSLPRPKHVPESLVYDFDSFRDPGIVRDPHARVLEIIDEAPPIFWTPRNGGHWVLCSHAAIYKAARDPDSFSSEMAPSGQLKAMLAALPPGAPPPLVPAPITFDPPRHAAYRAPLQSAFSPKSVLALKDDIRALAVELIETMKPAGRCEFMMAVAEPMPVTIFLKIFGLPVEKQKEYRALAKAHLGATDFDLRATQERLRKVASVMHDTIVDRQIHPHDDLISTLWRAQFDGKPATLSDLENYCVMLFVAGLDTVMNGMGLGVHKLAQDIELQRRLRMDPKLIPLAAEEILRRYTFTVPPRRVAKDMVFEGVTMRKDDRAVLLLPAADLDATAYERPQAFDIHREKPHIAFGVGPHRCLGSHLARVELQVLYEEMLARLPEFRIDPAKPVRYHGGHVWGPDELHLLW
jgi:cytochrome P450